MLGPSLRIPQQIIHMLQEQRSVDVQRACNVLGDLAEGLQAVLDGRPGDHWSALHDAVTAAEHGNGWFTAENVRFALEVWRDALTPASISSWLEAMPAVQGDGVPRNVGIITAGNIPLVGLHDLICGVVSGHRIQLKPSRDDAGLTQALLHGWSAASPGIAEQVTLAKRVLKGYDAVIATGSRNSGRYFRHYFGQGPHIIRGQRTSVAVLDGSETAEQMKALAGDIFRYFGLGCRNVTQVFMPIDFDLDRLFAAFVDWGHLADHHRYHNNYTYHKALWLMEAVDLMENGFVLLKEDPAWVSPVGALHYQRYADLAEVEARLEQGRQEIQCRVGRGGLPFGAAQHPGLDDYADGVDTMAFLLGLGT